MRGRKSDSRSRSYKSDETKSSAAKVTGRGRSCSADASSEVPMKRGCRGSRKPRGKSVDSAISTVDGAGGAILQAVAPATVSHLSLYPKEIARRRRQLNFKIISLTTRGRQPPQRNRPRLRGKRRERVMLARPQPRRRRSGFTALFMTFYSRVGQCADTPKDMYARLARF